jgi:hypothetical protein
MPHPMVAIRRSLAGSALACAVMLSGCADGLEMNGKVFDWMGISPAAQEARVREPKLAERAPLVMPPNPNRLPEPGSEIVPAAQTAWPDDPEQRKIREAKERERLHLAYCNGDIQWKQRALDKEAAARAPQSPYGPCPGLGSITSTINKD